MSKSKSWPPKPSFDPLSTNKSLWQVFGKFAYEAAPLPDDPEHIIVTDNWVEENIVEIHIPQLKSIDSRPYQFNKKIALQLSSMWKNWEDEGLLHLVKTFNGSYDARFRRGSKEILSCHAFGSAFDINAKWNPLHQAPALVDEPGSVRLLVTIANDHGFYWGGHFPDGLWDGMHFEVAIVKKKKKKKVIKKKKGPGHHIPVKKKQ